MTDKITVIVSKETETRRRTVVQDQISAEVLGGNLKALLENLSSAFELARHSVKGARLAELSVSVSVGAEGKLAILGTGVAGSAEGGLELKFVFEK